MNLLVPLSIGVNYIDCYIIGFFYNSSTNSFGVALRFFLKTLTD